MKDECLICNAPLEYLETDEPMVCAICHKKENSQTKCVNGHYACNECHTKGIDSIIRICLNETSKDPIYIIEKLMSQPFCHMHGPEHHVMVEVQLLRLDGNDESRKKCSRRSLRFLGCLRSGYQYGYVCFHHIEIHTSCKPAFCIIASDDVNGSWKNRRNWRSSVLQERFFFINIGCD